MKQVKNETGIKMYYEINRQYDKVEIYDSDKKYFNDLYYEDWDKDDISAILNMLKQTDLREMADFFNAQAYDTLEELAQDNYLEMEETKENDYINRFEINGKSKYTWSY